MFSREGGCGGNILMENSITFNGFLLQPSFSMCLFDIYSVSPTRIYCLFSRINLVTLITKYLLTSVKDSEKFYHWIYSCFILSIIQKEEYFPHISPACPYVVWQLLLLYVSIERNLSISFTWQDLLHFIQSSLTKCVFNMLNVTISGVV